MGNQPSEDQPPLEKVQEFLDILNSTGQIWFMESLSIYTSELNNEHLHTIRPLWSYLHFVNNTIRIESKDLNKVLSIDELFTEEKIPIPPLDFLYVQEYVKSARVLLTCTPEGIYCTSINRLNDLLPLTLKINNGDGAIIAYDRFSDIFEHLYQVFPEIFPLPIECNLKLGQLLNEVTSRKWHCDENKMSLYYTDQKEAEEHLLEVRMIIETMRDAPLSPISTNTDPFITALLGVNVRINYSAICIDNPRDLYRDLYERVIQIRSDALCNYFDEHIHGHLGKIICDYLFPQELPIYNYAYNGINEYLQAKNLPGIRINRTHIIIPEDVYLESFGSVRNEDIKNGCVHVPRSTKEEREILDHVGEIIVSHKT